MAPVRTEKKTRRSASEEGAKRRQRDGNMTRKHNFHLHSDASYVREERGIRLWSWPRTPPRSRPQLGGDLAPMTTVFPRGQFPYTTASLPSRERIVSQKGALTTLLVLPCWRHTYIRLPHAVPVPLLRGHRRRLFCREIGQDLARSTAIGSRVAHRVWRRRREARCEEMERRGRVKES